MIKNIVRLTAAMRERLRGVFLNRRAESELEEELRFHMEMEARKLAAAGLSPEAARRRAGATFGGVQRYKEEVREARGLAWLPGTKLDFALGFRMMKKHPSLTFVGGIGMSVGIAMSVGMFAFIRANIYPTIPLDEGDRIVAIENRDVGVNNEDRRVLHDFHLWRAEVKSVEEIGAFRTVERNFAVANGAPEPTQLAEMTAAGFRVARVAPLMGRYLIDADERAENPPVVVIREDVWRTMFGGRDDILSQSVRIAGVSHQVVGVMPKAFEFPQSHRLWVPLRADPLAFPRRRGPYLFVFGRLAPDATIESAQAELAAIGKRVAAVHPENAKIEPMVMPYIHSLTDIQGISNWAVVQGQLMMTLLLVIVAVNVAMLVYARTANRQGEIAVRTALGASRRRIVAQLFIEALMLSSFAAFIGLGLAAVGVQLGNRILETEMDGGLPFWVSYRLDPWLVLYTVGVAVFAAVIVGVVPALQATGKRLQLSLRELGGSGMRLGRTWTTLIVAQVALAVAVLPAAVAGAWGEIRGALTENVYDPKEFVMGFVQTDGTDAQGRDNAAAREVGDRFVEIVRRIEEIPGVVGASYRTSFADRRGLMDAENVDPPPGALGHRASSFAVAPDYLPMYGLKMLAGRALGPQDFDSASTAVIVNKAFVDVVYGGSPVLGRRIRYAERPADGGIVDARPASRWYQIVGVVENEDVNDADPSLIRPRVYYAVSPADLHQGEEVALEMRVRGITAAALAPKLREAVASVDPTLRLGDVRELAEYRRQDRLVVRLVGLGLVLVLVSVFLLSAAGVYALVSFTITRRRKEIGIRTALGATQRQVLTGVLGPVMRQIGIGLVIGIGGAAIIDRMSGGELFAGQAGLLLPLFGAMMTAVAAGAAFGPARRGLRTQPTEALRAEA
jgi:predicted permease